MGLHDNDNVLPVTGTKTVTATNAGSTQSNALTAGTVAITVRSAASDTWIAIGVNPTATVAEGAGKIALPGAGIPITVPVNGGDKVAARNETSASAVVKIIEHPRV